MQLHYNDQVYLSNGTNATTSTTYSGRASTLTLTNPGTNNTVNYIVTGLPASIASQNPLSGTIPPNSPSTQITWFGDFAGASVMVANTTTPTIPATLGVYLSAENP